MKKQPEHSENVHIPVEVAKNTYWLYRPVQMYDPESEAQKDGFLLMKHNLGPVHVIGNDVWALQGEMTLKEFAEKHVTEK